MKNLLSENMLRFGTKNLTEKQQTELVVKSIMETINQHGLQNVIKRKLNEQAEGRFDTPEFKTAAGKLDKQMGTHLKQGGVVEKIVGMLAKAINGVLTDKQMIADALKLIPRNGGKVIYDQLLAYVQKNPQTHKLFGKYYPTVMALIQDEMGRPEYGSEDWSGNLKWLNAYRSILNPYNDKEEYVSDMSSHRMGPLS